MLLVTIYQIAHHTHKYYSMLYSTDPGYTLDDKTPEELIAEELGETSRVRHFAWCETRVT